MYSFFVHKLIRMINIVRFVSSHVAVNQPGHVETKTMHNEEKKKHCEEIRITQVFIYNLYSKINFIK